jgi:hypothetical protein
MLRDAGASPQGAPLREAIVTQVDRKSHLMTDEAGIYTKTGEEFAGHSTVNHSIEEYIRHGGFTHTNTVEGYFSILKRGGVRHLFLTNLGSRMEAAFRVLRSI